MNPRTSLIKLNAKNLSGILAVVVSVLALGVWRFEDRGLQEDLLLVVYDRSLSPSTGCESVIGVVGQEMAVSSNNHRDFELALVATGDASTANEPKKIFLRILSSNFRVMDGKSGPAKARAGLLQEVRASCQALPRTDTSPILLAVKEGADQLRTMGATKRAEIRMAVVSDLEENVDIQMTRALRLRNSPYHPANPVPNLHMPTFLCGYAQTTGSRVSSDGQVQHLTKARDVERTERLRQVWRGAFTDPSSVTIEPFCPDASAEE
jgi:hypothetical protein